MHLRHKLVLILGLVGLSLAAIGWFIIVPTLRDIQSITGAIQEQRNSIEEKYQRGQLLRKLVEDFKKIGPDKDRLNAAFIQPGGELDFIIGLERLAASREVDFDPQREKADAKARADSFPLTLKLRGTFSQLLSYLQDLERLPAYFNVSSLQLNAGPDGTIEAVAHGAGYLRETPLPQRPAPVTPRP